MVALQMHLLALHLRFTAQKIFLNFVKNYLQSCYISQYIWFGSGRHMKMTDRDIEHFQVEKLKIEVHPTREAAGAAAAKAAAKILQGLSKSDHIGVVFATGASQIETLKHLTSIPNLPWQRVDGFHVDDYIGLPSEHKASFRPYLEEKLTTRVPMRSFSYIDGLAADPEKTCRDYAEKLQASNPQLCLLGIGENGHLAFNDPSEADFNDPLDVKIVRLDEPCRRQQAAEGWFKTVDEIPKTAITVTMSRLFRMPKLILSVLGRRKAEIVQRTFDEAVSTMCPSTILRTHPDATIFLDHESAANVKHRFSTVV
jgi:glucosamine-6-phosphate deaminase